MYLVAQSRDIPATLNAEWISVFCLLDSVLLTIGAASDNCQLEHHLIGADGKDKVCPFFMMRYFSWVKSTEYSHHLQLCNNKQHTSLSKMLLKYIFGMCNLMVSNQNAAIWKMQNVPSCKPRAIRKILKPACNWNNWQLYSLIKLQMFHFIRGLISRGSIRMLAGRVKNKMLQMLGWLEEEKVICRILKRANPGFFAINRLSRHR